MFAGSVGIVEEFKPFRNWIACEPVTASTARCGTGAIFGVARRSSSGYNWRGRLLMVVAVRVRYNDSPDARAARLRDSRHLASDHHHPPARCVFHAQHSGSWSCQTHARHFIMP